MRLSSLSRPFKSTRVLYCPWSILVRSHTSHRPCSSSCRLLSDSSEAKPIDESWRRHVALKLINRGDTENEKTRDISPADHRAIGTAQSLFTTHPSSPGVPFFQPDGTHIFQKLVSFLRAQYPNYGFREVLTPTMYKEELWKQSGHWENYKDDMFTVTGNSSRKSEDKFLDSVDQRMQPKQSLENAPELEEYGLKPMNCPGHCLLYKSERRSYRDLPIRYAEFSPLHRNELSGALSGLTRVRRFHQDDGHIFCRPSQVRQEIDQSLTFIRMVYETLGLPEYRFVLSTRPEKDYIGSIEDWDRAESQLVAALNAHMDIESQWTTAKGEGAFYGPKIDVILRDSDGKEHQTGTIQLDFQLPKRFELAYESPAPEMEAKGQNWETSKTRITLGKVAPVMVHRAILGSLERFMALLLENNRGKLPFWLSPNQVIILTVGDKDPIKEYAKRAKFFITTNLRANTPVPTQANSKQSKVYPKSLTPPHCLVDIDDSTDSIAQKVVHAKKKKYNLICVVGERNVAGPESDSENTMDLDLAGQPAQRKTWDLIDKIKPGSQTPLQQDEATGGTYRGLQSVRLDLAQCRRLIKGLNSNYC